MREFITPVRVANAIMQDISFTGTHLIVEGISDYHFYKKFFDDDRCIIRQAFGCDNVIEVIKILSERGFDRKFAIIDSDFRKLEGEPEVDDIFLTDDHDIEVMIFKSPALFRVLEMYYSNEKFARFSNDDQDNFRSIILNLAKPIGCLKWANKQYDLGLVFKPEKPEGRQIRYNRIFNDRNLGYNGHENMVDMIINYSTNRGTNVKSREEIITSLNTKLGEVVDLFQVCNGHDITNLISLALRRAIGNRNLDYKAIEEALILSFDTSEFEQTELYLSIREWENRLDKRVLNDNLN